MTSRRDVLRGAVAAALVSGAGMAGAGAPLLAQGRARSFAGVDPELIPDLRLLTEMEPSMATLEAFRHRPPAKRAQPLPDSPLNAVKLAEVMVPGIDGQPAVRTLQFDGAPGRRGRAAVVWIHGGGYVAGSAGIPLSLKSAAREHGWLIVSVDYRLAPEARLPQSLADNLAALAWVHREADRLGVDRARVAVGGASAGGGHAAMLALAARDRGGLPIAYQVLIYPMLDDRTGSSRAARPGTGEHIWTAAANRFGWTALLGVPAGSARVPARSIPGRRDDLAGLPPAFVGVGTLDLFLDEDIDYATRLAAAGVPVDLAVVPGAYHAFDGAAWQARVSRAFTARWIGDLATALG